jgi:hypothetical protein
MNWKWLRLPVAASAAIVTILTASASPASAMLLRVYEGDDYASLQTSDWNVDGYWVEVCDLERDGNGVYAIFAKTAGWQTVRDTNGSAGGCGNARVDLSTYNSRCARTASAATPAPPGCTFNSLAPSAKSPGQPRQGRRLWPEEGRRTYTPGRRSPDLNRDTSLIE